MSAKLWIMIAAVSTLLRIVPTWAIAQESATAEEVIQKTREAAEYLAKEGAAGLSTFKTMESPFAWKDDGYVFVIDCEQGRMLANPAFPGVTGRRLADMRDNQGMPLGRLSCENGQRTGGGWYVASIPKPGKSKGVRKLVFCRPAPGTTYQVCSGSYSDTANIMDLEKLNRAP